VSQLVLSATICLSKTDNSCLDAFQDHSFASFGSCEGIRGFVSHLTARVAHSDDVFSNYGEDLPCRFKSGRNVCRSGMLRCDLRAAEVLTCGGSLSRVAGKVA
jgi:hypothetical protein